MKPRPLTSDKGFTLIELLTVIAIIGILAAIIVPVVSSVRSKAQMAKCATNLRQVGIGFTLYLADNKGIYPSKGDAGNRWVHHIGGYLTQQVGDMGTATWDKNAWSLPTFRCTLTPSSTYGVTVGTGRSSAGVYGYNEKVAGKSETSMESTSQTILLAEKNYRSGMSGDTGASGPMLFTSSGNPKPFPEDPQGVAANHRSDGLPSKGGGAANYLYADGHVKTLSIFPKPEAFDLNPTR